MKLSPPLKKPVKVGELLRRRLKETERTPEELAEAAQVPPEYIDDLLAGRRRPPRPGRTDLYQKMTAFLRLSRNDLALCARAEREESAPKRAAGPKPKVRRLLLELCEPTTAEELERRRTKDGGAEFVDLIQRLLDVAQGAVRKVLDDQIGLRIAAERSGGSYVAARFSVLEFLDATPDSLTVDHLTRFLRPRVAMWDVDLETGVLRVVLRGQEPQDRYRRKPSRKAAF